MQIGESFQTEEITIEELTVVYTSGKKSITAVEKLDFAVAPSEFLCILGTTGCGKSTILNVIAGFVKPTSGRVIMGGLPISGPGPERGVVFQHHALFSWKTVRGNIEFGLKMKNIDMRARKMIADEYIKSVGLAGFEKSYPRELSGGMQQRVGLARALANTPGVVLMDEPFGSLDAQTRIMMQELLLGIWKHYARTIIFVTHDVDEAIFLADRIIVLTARPGRVKDEVKISLPRPRSYDIVTSEEYMNLKKKVTLLIREETIKSICLGKNEYQK